MSLLSAIFVFYKFRFPSVNVLFLRYNKIAIGYSILLVILCAFPGNEMPSMDFIDLFSFDKLAHLISFGLLCFFTVSGLAKYLHFSFMRRHVLKWALAYCLFLGAATEVFQASLAIHRTGDWVDFLANGIGIGIAALVYVLIYRPQITHETR